MDSQYDYENARKILTEKLRNMPDAELESLVKSKVPQSSGDNRDFVAYAMKDADLRMHLEVWMERQVKKEKEAYWTANCRSLASYEKLEEARAKHTAANAPHDGPEHEELTRCDRIHAIDYQAKETALARKDVISADGYILTVHCRMANQVQFAEWPARDPSPVVYKSDLKKYIAHLEHRQSCWLRYLKAHARHLEITGDKGAVLAKKEHAFYDCKSEIHKLMCKSVPSALLAKYKELLKEYSKTLNQESSQPIVPKLFFPWEDFVLATRFPDEAPIHIFKGVTEVKKVMLEMYPKLFHPNLVAKTFLEMAEEYLVETLSDSEMDSNREQGEHPKRQ